MTDDQTPSLSGTIKANDNQLELAVRLAELRAQKREIETQEKAASQALKDALITAGAEALESEDGEKLVHITEFERTSVDAKRLEALRPDIFSEFTKKSVIRQLRLG